MCFSATASFGVGIALSGIGVATLKKVSSPRQYVFASIPLLFSIQQITEGFLWLSLNDPAYAWMTKGSMYIFLVFAQVVWPLWVPVGLFLYEKEKQRKSILKFLSGIGLIVSLYCLYCLYELNVQARVLNHHVSYEFELPGPLVTYGSVLYFIATVLPPFLSSVKKMWAIGFIILASFIFAQMFFKESVISVWCFFAAIISIGVFLIIKEEKKTLIPILLFVN